MMKQAGNSLPSVWSRRGGFTVSELLIVCGIITVIAIMLTPAVQSVVQKSKATTCISRMKQIGSYILSYSIEHNGDLLPALQRTEANGSGLVWFQLLSKSGVLPASQWHQVKASIMECPARTTRNPRAHYRNSLPSNDYNGTHYAMTSFPGARNLIDMDAPALKLATIARPERTVLLVESDWFYLIYAHLETSRIYPHGDGCNLLYLDGHLRYHRGRMPLYNAAIYNQAGAEAPPFF